MLAAIADSLLSHNATSAEAAAMLIHLQVLQWDVTRPANHPMQSWPVQGGLAAAVQTWRAAVLQQEHSWWPPAVAASCGSELTAAQLRTATAPVTFDKHITTCCIVRKLFMLAWTGVQLGKQGGSKLQAQSKVSHGQQTTDVC